MMQWVWPNWWKISVTLPDQSPIMQYFLGRQYQHHQQQVTVLSLSQLNASPRWRWPLGEKRDSVLIVIRNSHRDTDATPLSFTV